MGKERESERDNKSSGCRRVKRMDNREQYEVNRKLLNSYRWWRETNGELPDYDTIIAAGLSDKKVTRSETNTRPFFLDLSKPLLLESEFNTYNLEYVVDNVRRSEDISMDNHVYLYFESLTDFAILCMSYDLAYILGKEKVFFLIGEKSKKDNYPYDFKEKCGIDYESMPGRDVKIEELNRIIIDCPTGAYSGNIFMCGILDAHPNLLTVKDFGMAGFPYIYERCMKGRTVKEIKNAIESSNNPAIMKEIQVLFVPTGQGKELFPVPRWNHFWDSLDEYFGNKIPRIHELYRAFFLAYNKELWGERKNRIIPAIRATTHSNAIVIRNNLKKIVYDSFKYRKQIQIIRNPIMKYASQISTALKKPLLTGWYDNLAKWNGVGRSTYILPEDRYMSLKWVKKDEINDNTRIIRFEDLKLNAEKGLKSLCSFIDIPFSETMLHTTSNGQRSVYYSPVNKVIDDFDPKPAIDYKSDYFAEEDIYRMELVLKKELKTFGYSYRCYDGKEYSDDKVVEMFKKPFRFYKYYYTHIQRDILESYKTKLIDSIQFCLTHSPDIIKGERLYPITCIDTNEGADLFDKYGGRFSMEEAKNGDDNANYCEACFCDTILDTHPGDLVKLSIHDMEDAFKVVKDRIGCLSNKLQALRKDFESYERIFLYGAGTDGRLIAEELECRNISSAKLCFIDRDSNKHGKEILPGIECRPISAAYGAGDKALILITSSYYAEEIAWGLAQDDMQSEEKLKNIKVLKEYCIVRARLMENQMYIDNYNTIMEFFKKSSDNRDKYEILQFILNPKEAYNTKKMLEEPIWIDNCNVKECMGQYYDNIRINGKKTIINGPFIGDVIKITRDIWENSDSVDVYEINSLYCEELKKEYLNDTMFDHMSFDCAVLGERDGLVNIMERDREHGYLDYISSNSINKIAIDSICNNEKNNKVGLIILVIVNAVEPALLGMKETIMRDKPVLIMQTGGHFTLQHEYYFNIMNLIESWGLSYKYINRPIPNRGNFLWAYPN